VSSLKEVIALPFRGTPHSFRRTLSLEALESRYALSTIVELNNVPCIPESSESVDVEQAATMDTVADAEGAIVGPLEADSYYSLLNAPTEEPVKIQAEGEASSVPVIDQFSGRTTMNYWIVSGHVTDDSVCRVYFGDSLEGHFVDTLPDGSFTYYTYKLPGLSGTVTAFAIDRDGNQSNLVTTFIGM
jgi:hypothetical protein